MARNPNLIEILTRCWALIRAGSVGSTGQGDMPVVCLLRPHRSRGARGAPSSTVGAVGCRITDVPWSSFSH